MFIYLFGFASLSCGLQDLQSSFQHAGSSSLSWGGTQAPGSSHCERGVLATGPPGKSPISFHYAVKTRQRKAMEEASQGSYYIRCPFLQRSTWSIIPASLAPKQASNSFAQRSSCGHASGHDARSVCLQNNGPFSCAQLPGKESKGVIDPPAPRQIPDENLIQLLAPKDLSECLLGISCPSNVYSQLETIKGLSGKPWVDVAHTITHSFNKLLRVSTLRGFSKEEDWVSELSTPSV